MKENLINTMSLINNHLINKTPLPINSLQSIINDHFPTFTLKEDRDTLSKLNRKIFTLVEEMEEQEKIASMKSKQIGILSQEEKEELFNKFENYIYDMVELPEYRSNSKKKKVYLGYLDNLWGNGIVDENGKWKGNTEDLFQQSRMFLWEVLGKYGKRPEKRKNFESRDRKGDKNSLSSISTFIYGSTYRLLINLGKSSLTDSRVGEKEKMDSLRPSMVEFEPELIDSYYREKTLPNMEFLKEEFNINTWKKLCKELLVPETSNVVKTLEGRIVWE